MNDDIEILNNYFTKFKEDLPDDFLECSDLPTCNKIDHNVYKRLKEELVNHIEFFPLALEELMEELLAILERARSTRESKLELDAKALEFWLEYRRFVESDIVKQKQIMAGEFQIPSDVADLQRDMHNENKIESQKIDILYERNINSRDYKVNQLAKDRLKAVKETTAMSAPPTQIKDVRGYAEDQEEIRLLYEEYEIEVSKSINKISIGNSDYLERIANKQALFEKENVGFKEEQYKVEQRFQTERAEFALKKGRGLNYLERIKELQEMFDEDFISAYSRAVAINKGVELLFGFTHPLPKQDEDSAITSLIIWVRQLLTKLTDISENEISYSHTISLKSQMNEKEWQEFIHSGKGSFDIINDQLPNHNSIRIRGMRLSTVSNPNEGFRYATFRVPKIGKVSHPNNIQTIDQTNVAPLYFGSISPRIPGYETNTCDARSFHNTSPIGKWEIEMGTISSNGNTLELIQDLIIEIHLTGISIREVS